VTEQHKLKHSLSKEHTTQHFNCILKSSGSKN
jgi:hypothetical protein